MNRINRADYQDDKIIEKMPETYKRYSSYAVRNFSIFNNWRKGETYASIGKHYDLSRQYTYEIVAAQRRLYDSIKKHRESKEQSIAEQNIKKIVDLIDYNVKESTRVFNCLARHFRKNIHDPAWNPYEAISKMNDRDYLNLRYAGVRTLLVFHEARDEARRRLEEDDSRVDTSDGEAT